MDLIQRWQPIVLIGVLLAAAAATYYAFFTNVVACQNPGSLACDRKGLAELQFLVAVVGLVFTALFVRTAWTGKRRAAGALAALGVATYAAWAILNDAAVHGWDDLRLLRLMG